MRPLTNTTPKPLLEAGGKPLIVWHLEKLAALGVHDVVVNTSWLAERFPEVLGDGSRWGLRLHFSYEGPTPLETGGGMRNALPLLGDDPFLLVNGDVWTDFDFARLPRVLEGDAHLVLVDNPEQHPVGDYALLDDGRVMPEGEHKLTYAGMGLYRAALFEGWRDIIGASAGAELTPPRFKLPPLLVAAMARGAVHGTYHAGRWTDVGTPQRLAELDAALR